MPLQNTTSFHVCDSLYLDEGIVLYGLAEDIFVQKCVHRYTFSYNVFARIQPTEHESCLQIPLVYRVCIGFIGF